MKKIFMLATMAMLFASCSKQESVTSNDNAEIRFNTAELTLTKTTADADGNSSWANNDEMGLFITHPVTDNSRTNQKYTRTEDDVWTPTGEVSYWTKNDVIDKTITFAGYYPYIANATTATIPMPTISAQTANITNQDFLFTKTILSGKTFNMGEEVVLNYSHALALVRLDVKLGNGITNATMQNITIDGTNVALGDAPTFNGLGTTNTISGASNKIIGTYTNTALEKTNVASFFLLVNPGEAERTYTFDYTNTDKTPNFTSQAISSTSSYNFERGKCYKYTVTINLEGIKFSDPTIEAWADGLTDGTMEAK